MCNINNGPSEVTEHPHGTTVLMRPMYHIIVFPPLPVTINLCRTPWETGLGSTPAILLISCPPPSRLCKAAGTLGCAKQQGEGIHPAWCVAQLKERRANFARGPQHCPPQLGNLALLAAYRDQQRKGSGFANSAVYV